MSGRSRGMALIQALVITAAVAAVATALMQQAERARLRVQARADADQAALYLDGGVELVRALLAAMPSDAVVHLAQDWAEPRGGLVIDRGELAYAIDDLAARLDVNALGTDDEGGAAARAAFVRLALGQGLTRRTADRMADALGPDPRARAQAAAPGDPLALPLADPRQLIPLAGSETDAFADLLPFLAARAEGAAMNINTMLPEVWQAWLPDLSRSSRAALLDRIAREPFGSSDELEQWADAALAPGMAERLAVLPLGAASSRFAARIEARLDTVVLRRSVVFERDGADGRVAIVLSVPETP